MIQFTQNNKIAIAAVMIFLVSFSVMLFSISGDKNSPEYVKASVLEASSSKHSEGDGGYHVYFSDSGTDSHADSHSTEESSDSRVIEDSYRIVTGNSDNPFFVLFPEGKVKFLSSNFVESYGYLISDFKNNNFFSVMDPDDLSDFAGEYTSVLQSSKARNGTGPYRMLKKDSDISVQIISLIPVIDENDKVTEIVGVVKDITVKMADLTGKTQKTE